MVLDDDSRAVGDAASATDWSAARIDGVAGLQHRIQPDGATLLDAQRRLRPARSLQILDAIVRISWRPGHRSVRFVAADLAILPHSGE